MIEPRKNFAWLVLASFLAFALPIHADGPADNRAEQVRPIPPPGITVGVADRAELQAGLDKLGREIEALGKELKGKPTLLDLLPDIQVYHKAVRYVLDYNEFFNAREIPVAKALPKQGLERVEALREGKSPWTTATGLIVRGYVSRIDGSVQPYGLVVPSSYHAGS